MRPTPMLLCTIAIPAMIAATPAAADTLRSGVAFNNGIGEKTANQPADGVEVSYQITLKGGDLDGCTVHHAGPCPARAVRNDTAQERPAAVGL